MNPKGSYLNFGSGPRLNLRNQPASPRSRPRHQVKRPRHKNRLYSFDQSISWYLTSMVTRPIGLQRWRSGHLYLGHWISLALETAIEVPLQRRQQCSSRHIQLFTLGPKICKLFGPRFQWCSPRDQGLGLEAPRGQKWKFWSWSWSWTFGLGLGLEEKVLQFFKTLLQFLTAVSKAYHGTGILWVTAKAVCHSEAIVWENFLRSMHISLSWEGI